MTWCELCGRSYFSASSKGRRSGLCAGCRLQKDGGLHPGRRIADASRPPEPGRDWMTVNEAARVLSLKARTLQTTPWLARLGAVKVGRTWWVPRLVVDALKEQQG